MEKSSQRLITCSCGKVELALNGAPIVSLVCYCDTCQEGSRNIEALATAGSVIDHDGGTAYVSYRKDRVACIKGAELLESHRLSQSPNTDRVTAACCKSALMMRFTDARHWIAIYRARFNPNAPPIQMRICTSFAKDKTAIPNDVPLYEEYSPSLVVKLLLSRLAMFFVKEKAV